MFEQKGFVISPLKLITSVIGIVTVLYLMFICTIGRVSHKNKDFEIIDSTKVQIVSQAEFKGKYHDLIPSLFKKDSIPSDSAKITVIEVVTRPAVGEQNDNDILDRVEQFYYNTYDKLLGTLAILLSVFSILIAFFGGLIPYLRASKAEDQLKRINRKMELQKKSADRQLKEIGAKQKESQETANRLNELISSFNAFIEGYEKRISKLIDKGRRIRTKLTKLVDTYYELINVDEKTVKMLKEYVDNTEMLETLGESLNADDYLFRALYYLLTEDEESFHEEFSQCVNLDKTHNPYATVADTYAFKGLHEKSLVYYDKAISIDSNDPRIWHNKGVALMQSDQGEKAIKCFDEALKLDPYFLEALFGKGVCHLTLGQDEDTIKCYDEATRLQPTNAKAWYLKSCYYALNNMKDKMLKSLSTATKLDTDWKEMAIKDSEFTAYWDDPDFKKLVE
ncbi:MAG: tetratricopeptide repeat protein [Candidatus Cloacimonetes bacterium]|nr:tetratricopeptide repeat protein [Candidatus Cloacimonadota bacterium]